jgi:hypothetical protein
MTMSGRAQRAILLWMWVFLVILGIALAVLMRMVPPPSATWSAERLAEWYQLHSLSIKTGAVIFGWTSGLTIQLGVVLWAQARRVMGGPTVWSTLILSSLPVLSVTLMIPGIAFGTAAYSPYRAPEITQLMHQFGVLTFVTTDQLYIGGWVAIAVLCFITPDSPNNPFPRWFGWLTIFVITGSEFGALAYLTDNGLIAINGILSFWIPVLFFFVWLTALTWLILKAIKVQDGEDLAAGKDLDATRGSASSPIPAPLAPAADS